MSRGIEEELEGEGPVRPTLPDPKTAKVAELAAYCRAVAEWPDGWNDMKAADKRVAFRRHFTGEATSTFDPNDPLHLISEEVEKMTAEQLAGAVTGAGEAVGFDYFRMGGALARISEAPGEFGCDTFKDWLAKNTDLTYGKARNLICCYVKLVELEVAWSRISGIGWTKVRMMVDVLDADSLEGWLEKAREMGKRELADEVKAAKRGDKAAPAERASSQTKKLSFDLHPDQVEVVEEALQDMADRSGSDHRPLCLERVCAAYLSGLDGKPVQVPAPRTQAATFEEGQEQLNALVARLIELSDSDKALDAVAEVLDVRFPKVDIDLKVS